MISDLRSQNKQKICGVDKKIAEVYVPLLNPRLEIGEITTKLRLVHFLAQLIAESNFKPKVENLAYRAEALVDTFKFFKSPVLSGPTLSGKPLGALKLKSEKIKLAEQFIFNARQPGGNYQKTLGNIIYANRNGNGDVRSGDGYYYRGHGLIQITGKNNFTKLTADTKIDYLHHPELLNEPLGAVTSALWFWKTNKLNLYADRDQIVPLSGMVNRGNAKKVATGMKDRKEALLKCKIAFGLLKIQDKPRP